MDLNSVQSKTLLELQSLICDPDNVNLAQALIQSNFINIYGKDGIKVSDYINFLVTDIKYCFLLVLFQKQLSKKTLGIPHWKEIKNRRNIMIDYYNYIEKHKKPPKESTIKKISRILKREHNPYQFDYSCDINDWTSIEIELLDDCMVKYHHNITMPVNPRINLLKRTGSTYTVERPSIKAGLLINDKTSNITPIMEEEIEGKEERKEGAENILINNKYPQYSPIRKSRKLNSDDYEVKEESKLNNSLLQSPPPPISSSLSLSHPNVNTFSEMKINTNFNDNGVNEEEYEENLINDERINELLKSNNINRPSLSNLPTPISNHIFFSKSNSPSPRYLIKTSMGQCQIASQKNSLRSKEVNLPGQVCEV